MEFLILSDFHGKIPKILIKKLSPEKFDAVLCPGDLADTTEIRNFEFKYWDLLKSKNKKLFLIKNLRKYYIKAIKSMKPVVKFLDSLNTPVFLVYGNSDFLDKDVRKLKLKLKGLDSLVKQSRNIILLKTKRINFKGLTILGLSGYRNFSEKFPESEDEVKKADRSSKILKKRISSLFLPKAGKCIFLAHDIPYKTWFDVVRWKKSPAYGKHIGDYLIKQAILKFKPNFFVCGHMHENSGIRIISKTTVINPGAAYSGHFSKLICKQ